MEKMNWYQILDIGSAELNTFDSVDKEWLEKICSLLQR